MNAITIRPAGFGILAFAALLGVYFGILTLVSDQTCRRKRAALVPLAA